MAKKREYVPVLNTLELLLQGGPGEFLDAPIGDQPESDRSAMERCARNWVGNEHLAPDERARIQSVWLDGVHQPPLNVNRARREELRALVVPRRRVRESRPNAEQLQAMVSEP